MYNKEILRKNFTYLNGGFYKKGADPKKRASWIHAKYMPMSEPTIFINDTLTYLKNAVYVYHVGEFDPGLFAIIHKDNNIFNNNIENLKLIKKKSEQRRMTGCGSDAINSPPSFGVVADRFFIANPNDKQNTDYIEGAYAAYFGNPPENFIVIPLDGNYSNFSKDNLGLVPMKRA